jgi:phosphate transport system permease protein
MEMAITGKRLKDNLFTAYCIVSLLIIIVPLIHIIGTTVFYGIQAINVEFFTALPKPPGEAGGGIANAIQGTLILAVLTMAISIPSAILAAIYLAEYENSRFKELIRLLNDTFMGTPSIVAGIFGYALIVVNLGGFSAIAGAFALSVLAVPMILRASEEALKLVPNDIREAGLSLGIEYWIVITRIVLKTAFPAIASGILLALARIMGETAPLLFTAFGNPNFASSIFEPISALPLIIFIYATSPYPDWHQKAWGAALVLMLLVLGINMLVKYKYKR